MTPDQSKNIAAYLATKVRKGKGRMKGQKPMMKMKGKKCPNCGKPEMECECDD